MTKGRSRGMSRWKKELTDSWWVMAFILISAIFYEQGLHRRDSLYTQLVEQWNSLLKEKQQALEEQNNLEAQINSQGDLAWVELTLIRELGLVPEGQQKVYFYQIFSNHQLSQDFK